MGRFLAAEYRDSTSRGAYKFFRREAFYSPEDA
jgi:hypothetical protein